MGIGDWGLGIGDWAQSQIIIKYILYNIFNSQIKYIYYFLNIYI